MPKYSDFVAAIFDVDDTLLDNTPGEEGVGLHEQSRLAAAHEVGRRYGSIGLQQLTLKQSADAFRQTQVHSIQAAVWQMLVIAGEVEGGEIDHQNVLLLEMLLLKEELHEAILRAKGQEVAGATRFVQALADHGFTNKLAVASTSSRRDIDIFFEMTKLGDLFPSEKIISRERLAHPKPHPDSFNQAFAALRLPADTVRARVLAFEDDPRGVESAKAAGLFTCAIATRFSPSQLRALSIPPDLVAGSYAEFAELFGLPALRVTPKHS